MSSTPSQPTQEQTPQPKSDQTKLSTQYTPKKITKNPFSTSATDVYSKIISANYISGGKAETSMIYRLYQNKNTGETSAVLGDFNSLVYKGQVVDILHDYTWNIQKFTNSRETGQIKYANQSPEKGTINLGGTDYTDKNFQEYSKNYGDNYEDKGYHSLYDKGFKAFDVPMCYVTQWRQKMSSNIMNFINTMAAAASSVNNMVDALTDKDGETTKLADVSKTFNKLKDSLLKGTEEEETPSSPENNDDDWLSRTTSKIVTKMGEFGTEALKALNDKLSIGNPAQNSGLLKPYSLLYSMKLTGKKYCFPMIANPYNNNLQNMFVDADQGGSFLTNNGPLNLLTSLSGTITNTARDAVEMINLLRGRIGHGGYVGSAVEKAKFYQFPTHTDEYRVTFPLLNTVNAGDWKKNYRFIMLFMLRNMLFRKDNASYYPPLFYDLIIPGTVRQPFCYVSRVDVRPVGMVRMLGYDQPLIDLGYNGTTQNSNIGNNKAIPVPEAWIVTITFNSLLTTSANMVLSGLYDLQISTSS